MKIQVIGAGVVGQATGKGLSQRGHTVYFTDRRADVVSSLVDKGYKVSVGLVDADIYFICTHEDDVESIVCSLRSQDGLIVIRSTTPPGTTQSLMKLYDCHICHNPEFLREESARDDFLNPSRIVIGECCKEHGDLLEELYKPFDSHIVRTNPTVSELSKLASNTALACSISYWNEVKQIADRYNVDYRDVFKIAGLDARIPRYGLRYTGPFGGKCFPKDLDAFIRVAKAKGVDSRMLKAIKEVNEGLK